MDILVIDKNNHFHDAFVAYIQKKFNGVHVTVFYDLNEVMDSKKTYDIACLDQLAYKEYKSSTVYKKYIKDNIYVCDKQDVDCGSNEAHIQIVSEEELKEVVVKKIRELVKKENHIKVSEVRRKKYLSVYIFVYLLLMVFATAMDRTGKFSSVYIAIFILGLCCINSFYFIAKGKEEFSKKSYAISILISLIIIIICFWEDITTLLQSL